MTADAVRYAGLALELVGLTLAGIGVAQRRRFAERPGILGQIGRGIGWVRQRIRRGDNRSVVASAGTVAGTTAVATPGIAVAEGSKDPEERLRLLEESMQRLEAAQASLETRLVDSQRALLANLTEEQRTRAAGDDAILSTMRNLAREDLALEAWGVFVFMAGLLCTTIPEEISRWLR